MGEFAATMRDVIDADHSRSVTRLEGFSDAVFGFALTLLVVSLETPKSFADLADQMRGFVPFALMFAMVCWIWYEHNLFFRRYGLRDAWTVFLNAVLLFVVLFYVYPLRFLTTMLVGGLIMRQSSAPDITLADGRSLMAMYSLGVLLIFGAFVMLYRHAWRRRAAIGLDALGELRLRFRSRSHVISASLAVVSLLLLLLIPGDSQYAGWVYALMGPAHAWNGSRAGRAETRLKAVGETAAAAPAGSDTSTSA
jgi:uncharacterized membrane protein